MSKLTCNCSFTGTVLSLFANVLCSHTQKIPLQGSILVTRSSTVASPAQLTSKHPLVAFERLDWTLFFNNSHSSLNKQQLSLSIQEAGLASTRAASKRIKRDLSGSNINWFIHPQTLQRPHMEAGQTQLCVSPPAWGRNFQSWMPQCARWEQVERKEGKLKKSHAKKLKKNPAKSN